MRPLQKTPAPGCRPTVRNARHHQRALNGFAEEKPHFETLPLLPLRSVLKLERRVSYRRQPSERPVRLASGLSLNYLGCSTHRVAIGNSSARLREARPPCVKRAGSNCEDDGRVHPSLLLHMLPKGFGRTWYLGCPANVPWHATGAYSHSNAPEPTAAAGTGRLPRADLRLPCHDPQFHAALPCNTKKCSLLSWSAYHLTRH